MEYKTIPQLFELSVNRFPDNVFLREKRKTSYEDTTYAEAYGEVRRTARGLISMGLEKGDRVALISEGRNDWVISELAVLFAGGVSVPLSVKIEEASDLHFRLEHSGCRGIIVSGNHQHKVFDLLGRLPAVEFVVILDPPDGQAKLASESYQAVIEFVGDVRKMGDNMQENGSGTLEKVKDSIQPADYANICYTSGTTADPKGIILTHFNYIHNVEQASAIFEVPQEFTSLHILPWDHSFAHTVGIYALMRNGASLASLKTGRTTAETIRNIPDCIKEVRPYFLLSVPALAKNFRNNIERGVRDKGLVAWGLFNIGLRLGYAYNREGYNRGSGWRKMLKPLYKIFDSILFKKVRSGFGGRLRYFVGGGALLDIELQRFFYAIGIPMYQGYGLTEASPVISSNTPEYHKLGSSGKVVPWLDLKICGEDGTEKPIGEQGEIVVRGDNVMAGYWKNETATSDSIRNGWLFTGDLGYLDNEGYLYVLGRTKSLLIGSDGEKYSPEGIEEALAEHSPFFDQVMLYNNQKPYTTALIVVNRATLLDYLARKGLSAGDEKGQRLALEKVKGEIERFMPGGELGGKFPQRWLPAAVVLLPEAFSESNGMINSTMKIVRPVIHRHYSSALEFLYTPEGKDIFSSINKKAIESLVK